MNGDAIYMKLIKNFVKCIDNISLMVGKFVSYFIFVIIVITIIEIICRYFFNKPTVWSYELGQMLFGAYFLLVGAMVLQDREHIGMDILVTKLSDKKQAIFNVVTALFTILFCLVLVWKGWHFAFKSIKNLEHSTSVWGPPLYPFKATLPLAGLLVLLQAISNMIKDIYFVISGKQFHQ